MLSHPNKGLKEHLDNVTVLGLSIFDNANNIWSKDNKIREVLKLILSTHDYGKATKYFQEYIKNLESEKYKKSPFKDYKKHGLFSALWTYYLVLNKVKDEKLSSIAYMVVKKHHGDLVDFESVNFSLSEKEEEEFEEQIDAFEFSYFDLEPEKNNFIEFAKSLKGLKLKRRLKKVKNGLTAKDYVLCNYLFSILISSDKGEAIYNDKGIAFTSLKEIKKERIYLEPNLVDNYKASKFSIKSEIDRYREDIYIDVEESIHSLDLEKNRIFSINVPTGTGKTLTSLNAALKLRERLGENNRIVYNLPFTSIIDQNFDVFSEVLGALSNESKVLIKHHYLSDTAYTNHAEVYEYDISKYYIENWDSEIIVTTFVQLISSIFSNKNRKLKKYHNFSNSIIILDEIQSIPHKYWNVINETFRAMAETLNCYFILVTATMPLIFREDKKEIIELAKYKREYFDVFNRITLDTSMLNQKISINDFNLIVERDIVENNKDSFLFVLNTIKSSLQVYNFLKDNFIDKDIIYLSTNIIPKERVKRIKQIKSSPNCIVIATQMVEAGVDIDLDRVYRDFGPLDSINQVCGRCNRNARKGKKGIVKLFNLIDEDNRGKPYFNYIYEDFLGNKTNEVLKGFEDRIEEKDFFNLASNYFNSIYNGKSDDISNNLIEKVKNLSYSSIKLDLISNDFKTVDVFIELDNEATILWNKYKSIFTSESLKRYDKQVEFSRIKKDFLSYVISVPKKFYDSNQENFSIIESSMLTQYYDEDTGFKREDKQEDYIF